MTSEAASEKATGSEAALVWCAAAVALLIWGATPMVTRIAVLEIDPAAVGILRTVLGAILALPLAFALRLSRPHGAAQWLQLLISALGGFVVFPVLFGLGVRHTSASHAALVLAVAPLFTGLIASAVERRAPSAMWWLGAGLAFAGEVALVVVRSDVAGNDASLGGDLLVLVACVSAAAGYVAGARLAQKITTWAATFWGIGLGGAILLPLAAVRLGPQAWGSAGALGWSAIAYLALGATITGYICWYWALQRGGIARIGTTQFAQPLIALGFAVAVLHEPLTAPLILAALLIVAGVALAQRR
ncbi:MAG TPA: DMT family transporter [Stellaceae bacterium]|nr:DMT family transporter [Stellaceae bacterium]